MRIDQDVRALTSVFGLDPELLQAVVVVEGDILEAVQRRYPKVRLRDEALPVVARCGVRAMCDWIRNGGDDRRRGFITTWAQWWTLPQEAPCWRNAMLRELARAEASASARI